VKKYLLIENIRSAYNVGAMFRTADGAGVTKIFLCGYTPTPVDRFSRAQAEIKKTSLGASESVAWEKFDTAAEVIARLQGEGVTAVALEQTERSITLQEFALPEKVLYIVGNEVEGVSPESLAAADAVVDLPMLGEKESLNVATAAGILMYYGLV